MAELDDDRIRFYLRYRAQIETWAGLRAEAGVAIDAQLEQLSDDVTGLCADLGSDVRMAGVLDGEVFPRFLLHRASWGCDPKNPRAAVGLEWARGKTFLDGSAAPYVGVRFVISEDDTRLMRNRFRDATQAIRARRGDKASPWWPSFGYVPADGEFWTDFAPYRQRLLGALREAWGAYAPALEEMLIPSRA